MTDLPPAEQTLASQEDQAVSSAAAPALEGAASDIFVKVIPIAFARRHRLVGLEPLADHPGAPVRLAMADPSDLESIEVVARRTGLEVEPVAADEDAVQAAINRAYETSDGGDGVDQVVASINPDDRAAVLAELRSLDASVDLLDSGDRSPVIKLVSLLLAEAVKSRASDVHLQPHEHKLVARLRIDGVLYDSFDLPKAVQEEVVSRVKVMARMDIAEKRLPQDGRTAVRVGDRSIDLRVSTLPTNFGERAVIRLLDKSRGLMTLAQLGMPEDRQTAFRRLVAAEHGIVLVTGPTGSGKTTTLYAALAEADRSERNVLTIEDPIEYQLSGVSQTQVNVKKGMTFAGGLRSILRQDPDVIMVGEIRDHETAEVAIQASLTGHLVLSTLHTNDAASAVTRLVDLGIEPYLVASSVTGVAAQRLLRRNCQHCAQPQAASAADLAGLTSIGIDPHTIDLSRLRRGAGCEACRDTGYLGRTAIQELLPVNQAVIRCVQDRGDANQIREVAVAQGMVSLQEDALRLLLDGETTADELLRVASRSAF